MSNLNGNLSKILTYMTKTAGIYMVYLSCGLIFIFISFEPCLQKKV